jgi:murein DD-endopeptidase MepM/ murein hydrolase activator NlpD
MQLLFTGSARTRVLQFQHWQLWLGVLLLVGLLMALSGAVYHFIFLKAAREGWPVVSDLVRPIVRDEIAERDRVMRENLDAMAQKVGEMQAKLIRLEAIGERVSGLAGVKPDELRTLKRDAAGTPGPGAKVGSGGPFIPARPSSQQLQAALAGLDTAADVNSDLFTLFESRLMETRLRSLMIPSAPPVDGPVGSGFGFRTDPINGRAALHTGLDFPAEVGTPIQAAAGGIVVARDWHTEYGHVLEIDHGNGLTTRYAHCSDIAVAVGALVKRGQRVARVGTSGRTTGAHLHFEVLLDGAPQDPARFLASTALTPGEFALRPWRR